MMRVVAIAGLAVSVVGPACKKGDAQRVKKAYDEVIDHSVDDKGGKVVYKKIRFPRYVVGPPREDKSDPERKALVVDIEVDPYERPARVKRKLMKVTRLAKGGTSLQVVITQAWPSGLLNFGGVLGYAYLAADGRGIDGRGSTFRGVKLVVETKPQVKRPSALDLRILQVLETRRKGVLADLERLPTRVRKYLKKPGGLERYVIGQVAPRMGFTVASVEKAVQNAQKYWYKPRWQPRRPEQGQ